MSVDTVGDVNAGGVLGEVFARQMQHRVGQRRIVNFSLVLELPHVVGEDDLQRLGVAREAGFQILAVPLHAGPERPEVHPVRPDADAAAPAAGPEGHDLVEGIEQIGPLFGLHHPFELRPISGEVRLRQPLDEELDSLLLEGRICIDAWKPCATEPSKSMNFP